MRGLLGKIWSEDDGALSFEWCIVTVLLVFGIVSGLSASRDALIDELSDIANAMFCMDQSYSFVGIGCIPDSEYVDSLGTLSDCARNNLPGQPAADDIES